MGDLDSGSWEVFEYPSGQSQEVIAMVTPISDLDIVFISYDEPGANNNFEHLKRISPRPPLRVHGIKGFDAAHKAAANLATTGDFITVDGDNMVRKNFFETQIILESDYVYSFSSYNVVNGLTYGNGGVKIWPKKLLLEVDTHEKAEGNDFCWTYRYWQMNDIASDNHFNASSYHAFRSGYREAVKLSLVEDKKLKTWEETVEKMYPPNLSRLMVWATIGRDVLSGEWAIYGARSALHDLWVKGIELDAINDYDFLWSRWMKTDFTGADNLGRSLEGRLGTQFPIISPNESKWFKSVYINIDRHGPMLPNMKPVLESRY